MFLWTSCAGSFCEPQCPSIHKWMLDIEVFGIMEDGQGFGQDDSGRVIWSIVFEVEFFHCLCWRLGGKNFSHDLCQMTSGRMEDQSEKGEEMALRRRQERHRRQAEKIGDDRSINERKGGNCSGYIGIDGQPPVGIRTIVIQVVIWIDWLISSDHDEGYETYSSDQTCC